MSLSLRPLAPLSLILSFTLLLLAPGLGAQTASTKAPITAKPAKVDQRAPSKTPSLYSVNGVDVEEIIKGLTLKEKVGQMLFLGFGGTVMDGTISRFLDEKKPGAVALFSRNIKNVTQTTRLIREVRKHDPKEIPMFVSVDQEGGDVVRIRGPVTIVPSNMAIGATHSEELAMLAGIELGKDLQLLGFNMNLAPVLDVNSNPKNPVIGIRSFGEDPQAVGRLGVAYALGLQSQSVSAVAKHFPGHGDTEVDSHHEMPKLMHDRERLMRVELPPFRKALAEGLDALMTAHISLPNIAEEADMPATVSKNVLTGLLRQEFGYQGLLVTDGLEMEGIVSRYGSGEAAVRAVEAGADMVMVLWFKEKKDEVQQALLKAVKSGRVSEARIEQSVRRILRTKARRGLFGKKLLSETDTLAQLKSRKREVVTQIAQQAITLVRNEGNLLPLSQPSKTEDPKARKKKILVLTTENAFAQEMKKALGARGLGLSKSKSKNKKKAEHARLASASKGQDVVIVASRNVWDGLLVPKLRAQNPKAKIVVVSLETPYMLTDVSDADAYLCAYAFRGESVRAAANVVLGRAKAQGHLPVTLSKDYARGHGLSLHVKVPKAEAKQP